MSTLADKLTAKIINWLTKEEPNHGMPLSDFDRVEYEVRPCDVILVEGRSRVSNVIRLATQSPWTHSALYIGRLLEIENPALREHIKQHYDGKETDQLVIESYLGKGTIVTSLNYYRNAHIRICRPKGISRRDAQQVIGFAIGRLGLDYDIRHIIDLARLLLPWSIIPRRWRSSLFRHNTGTPTRQICSALIAEAFASVRFPILPLVQLGGKRGVELIPRNPRLTTPSDFDYSPYFDIIKYSFFTLEEHSIYRNLPWNEEGLLSNDGGRIQVTEKVIKEIKAKVREDNEQDETPADTNTDDDDKKLPPPKHRKDDDNNDFLEYSAIG